MRIKCGDFCVEIIQQNGNCSATLQPVPYSGLSEIILRCAAIVLRLFLTSV